MWSLCPVRHGLATLLSLLEILRRDRMDRRGRVIVVFKLEVKLLVK